MDFGRLRGYEIGTLAAQIAQPQSKLFPPKNLCRNCRAYQESRGQRR
jgi:hypothetical protein